MERVKIGVIGCGAISTIYLDTMISRFGDLLEVVGCSSRNDRSAINRAAQYRIRAMKTEELLADPAIELIVNLTPAGEHEALIRQALCRGKHVYTEKPLATNTAAANALVKLARDKGLLLCCAPDTILSAGVQTAFGAVAEGLIGTVTSCCIYMNRDYGSFYERLPFLLLPGAGSGADIGPYFLTTAVYLLGGIQTVAGMTRTSRPLRYGRAGAPFTVTNDNQFMALLAFKNGILGTLHLNADAGGTEQPSLTLLGTEGTLVVESPNKFCKRVLLTGNDKPTEELPLLPGYSELLRGLGVAEMAVALRKGRIPKMDAAAAAHIVEVTDAIYQSSQTGAFSPVFSDVPASFQTPFTPELVKF